MKLSILICHLPERKSFLRRLITTLHPQLTDDIEVIINDDEVISIGKKRNFLLQLAKGEYVAFIDDDDFVSDRYFQLLFDGIEKGVDCCSLVGEITENGVNPLIFEHSIKYKEYKTNEITHSRDSNGDIQIIKPYVKYERYPNHLNCIKSSIAKQFKFPEKNHGEDTEWATQIFKSGLLKTEHEINEVIYYYDWRTK